MAKSGRSSSTLPRTSSKAQRTQQERRDATSNAVLQSAVKLFGERGYQKTSLEDIAADCGTTIRPIYHYYKNKKSLFLAVAEFREQQLLEVFENLEAEQGHEGNPLPLTTYWQVFTQVCQEPGFRQIVLLDAPTILGRDRWLKSPIVLKAIDYFYDLYPSLGEQNRILVARVFVAALTEAALVLSEYESQEKQPSFTELLRIFEGLTGVGAT